MLSDDEDGLLNNGGVLLLRSDPAVDEIQSTSKEYHMRRFYISWKSFLCAALSITCFLSHFWHSMLQFFTDNNSHELQDGIRIYAGKNKEWRIVNASVRNSLLSSSTFRRQRIDTQCPIERFLEDYDSSLANPCGNDFINDWSWRCGFGCSINLYTENVVKALTYGKTISIREDKDLLANTYIPLSLNSNDFPICASSNRNLGTKMITHTLPIAESWVLKEPYEKFGRGCDEYFLGLILSKFLLGQPDYLEVSNCIGVHVRRCDKIDWGEMNRIPVSRYILEAASFIEDTDYVFVMTDDFDVLEEFRIYGWKVMTHSNGRCSKSHKLQSQFMRDVLHVTKCKHVICTWSSNVCRLIHRIRQVYGLSVIRVSE